MWRKNAERGESRVAFWSVQLLAITIIAIALIFALLAGLSPRISILILIVCAVLMGGIVYSVRALSGAGYPRGKTNSSLQPHTRMRAEPQVPVSQPTGEPYPHHEAHPESPGQDQGQLTSHLPGSTPFVK